MWMDDDEDEEFFDVEQFEVATPTKNEDDVDTLLNKMSYQQVTRQEDFYLEFQVVLHYKSIFA